MATAKWSALNTQGSNIASTTLDSLANGSASSFVTFDNSTGKDLYAFVELILGSITPSTGGSVTICIFPTTGGTPTVPDNTAAIGGGEERKTIPLTSGAGVKTSVVQMRIPPGSLRVSVVNNAGVSLASSGNSLKFQTFDEDIS